MPNLLIVDDEPYAVQGVKATVEAAHLGFTEVFTAFDGAQARAVLAREAIDVVLCDIEMPQLSGLELLSWMRTEGYGAEVIFLTCHADLELAQQAMRLKSCDFLVKPAQPDDLRRALVRALGRDQDSTVPVPAVRSLASEGRQTAVTPDPARWTILLKSGARERVRFEARSYLAALPPGQREDTDLLRRLFFDFQQVVSAVLKSRSISAQALLSDPRAGDLFRAAGDDPEALVRWIDYALDAVAALVDTKDTRATPFGQACRYIERNLSEELSCDQIATQVGLHPDYLTRVFKKESGLSVTAYVTRARMLFAAELLENSGLAVGDVASQLGYANASHFSQVFRKVFGHSPQEHRALRGARSVVG